MALSQGSREFAGSDPCPSHLQGADVNVRRVRLHRLAKRGVSEGEIADGPNIPKEGARSAAALEDHSPR